MNRDASAGHTQEESLEGVSEVRVECDNTDFVVESDPSLSGVLQLIAEPAENAPVLSRNGSAVLIEQSNRYRGSAAPVLRVPDTALPGLTVAIGMGDVVLEQVQADIDFKLGQGDLHFVHGAGSVAIAIGQGDVHLQNCRGSIACKIGQGDLHIERCTGPATLQLGNGDIHVAECKSDLAVQSGSGDVAVSRPHRQSIAIKAGKGDVVVKDGSAVALNVKVGKGDIVSRTRFLADVEPETPAGSEPEDFDFQTTDESVHFNLADFQFEAGESGVRIARGGRDLFRAGPEGVRLRRGDGDDLNIGPEGIKMGAGRNKDRFSFVTDKGDVVVHVPDDIPVRVETIVNNGTVASDVPLVEVGRPGPRGSRRRYVGVSDSAEGERLLVRAQSDRGDIALRLTPMPDAGAPSQAEASSRDARVRAVLESLANGEITADEANTLLQALEREA